MRLRLKIHRIKKNMLRKDLACELNVSENTLRDYEDGKTKDIPLNISMDWLEALGMGDTALTANRIRHLFANKPIDRWSEDEYNFYRLCVKESRRPSNYVKRSAEVAEND